MFAFGVIMLFLWSYIRIAGAYNFDVGCKDYLQLASNSVSIELAESHIAKAIEYAESKNLTNGVVSILFKYPTNDVGIWYTNLVTAHKQLQENIGIEVTELEESNMLMKLRETLTDTRGEENVVIHPEGISIYPHNILLCVIGVAGIVFVCAGILGWKTYFYD
jgi:hypothetical protein